jgi:predicted Zn-dependent protease
VLGHEIGHVTARHINDQMKHEMEAGAAANLASVLLEGKGGAIGATVTPLVINLGSKSFVLTYSRDQELEADSLGMRYMTKVKYNPVAMQGVMEVLQQAMQGNTTPEFFSTHPYPDTRIKAIQKALSTTYANVKNDPSFVLGEAEYQQKLLRPLNVKTGQVGPAGAELAAAALGDPVTWCQHCREAVLHAAVRANP